MKTRILLLLILLLGCTSKNPQKNISIENVVQKTRPDTINVLGDLRIGMTIEEISKHIKGNPNKFFVDKKYLMPMIRTKIDNVTYTINIDLYKGKLYRIGFLGDNGWTKIDDVKFKEHYKTIYSLLKNLNKYANIKDNYFNEFKVDWPYSYGGKSILMAQFAVTDNYLLNDSFLIFIGQDEETFKYYLTISYTGEKIENFESTLSKSLYYDDL